MKRIFLHSLFLLFFVLSSRAQNGNMLWNNILIHDIRLDFTYPSFYDTLIANHSLDVYTNCDITIDGTVVSSVGAKFKGNSSFNNPSRKKSIKIDLNEFVSGQDYDGIKKINLNNGFKDPSFLREKVALDFMNNHQIAAPRCAYARVYMNGIYWGLFTLVEEVNNDFCDRIFGSSSGNRFKGDPSGDFRWYGSADTAYYRRYELDNNETLNDWSDLVNLINTVNNSSAAQFQTGIDSVFNANNFIRHWAIDNLFVNLDSYIGSGHNYYIYDESVTGKFEWIHWDVNEAFGNFQLNQSLTQLKTLPYNYVNTMTNRPLCSKMLANPVYHQQLKDELCLLNADFDTTMMNSYIDSLASEIRPDVYADTLKTYTNLQFENNVNSDISIPSPGGSQWLAGIKSFISERHTSLFSQLNATGACVTALVPDLLDAGSLELFPNPATQIVYVKIPEDCVTDASLLQIMDLSGRTFLSTRITGEVMPIKLELLSDGLYLVRCSTKKGVFISKLIVSR